MSVWPSCESMLFNKILHYLTVFKVQVMPSWWHDCNKTHSW